MTPRHKPLVVVAGTFQRGKSTLINGLIGHAVAEVGEGLPTTHGWTRYRAGTRGGIEAVAPDGCVLRCWPTLPCAILDQVDLADLPGLNAGGSEGEADMAAANDALAHADIVLHVTDQSGLGGEVERDVLRSARRNQLFVIALQNVFVPCSTAKRDQWLALLEKQLADLGVVVWRLQPNTLALSINALRLAQATGAAPTSEETPGMPLSAADATQSRKASGLEPLIEFLSKGDSRGLGVAELCDLRQAVVNWAARRAGLVTSHLETFIKPCQ